MREFVEMLIVVFVMTLIGCVTGAILYGAEGALLGALIGFLATILVFMIVA